MKLAKKLNRLGGSSTTAMQSKKKKKRGSGKEATPTIRHPRDANSSTSQIILPHLEPEPFDTNAETMALNPDSMSAE